LVTVERGKVRRGKGDKEISMVIGLTYVKIKKEGRDRGRTYSSEKGFLSRSEP